MSHHIQEKTVGWLAFSSNRTLAVEMTGYDPNTLGKL